MSILREKQYNKENTTIRLIDTLEDLINLTDKTLKIKTLECHDTGLEILKEVNYKDKYVYYCVHTAGYTTWFRNEKSSKITKDIGYFDIKKIESVYDFAKYLGLKVAISERCCSDENVYVYTEDSDVFTCKHCGKTHLLNPQETIFYENDMICEPCSIDLTRVEYDYNGKKIDNGIRIKNITFREKTIKFLYNEGETHNDKRN